MVSRVIGAPSVSFVSGRWSYGCIGSAGGPIVAPSIAGILVTPSSPHSVFDRAMMVDQSHSLTLTILPPSGRLAVEVDGKVATYVRPGDIIAVAARSDAAQVVRLGQNTFYQRVQRKLGVTSSTELSPWVSIEDQDPPPEGR